MAALFLRPRVPLCAQCVRLTTRHSSTDAPASPLLQRLRTDLKTAMRAKDAARLSAIRAVLAEVTNAAKTSAPVTTDMQLLAVLRKRRAAGEAARDEFERAGRGDIAAKEAEELRVLEEYAGGVEVWGEEEIRGVVKRVVDEMKEAGQVRMGDVLKRLFAAGGEMDGKPVEKIKVSVAVKQLLS